MNDVNNPDTCGICGGDLIHHAGQSHCPVCVMQNALAPDASELESATLDVTESLPGGASPAPENDPGESSRVSHRMQEFAPGTRFGDYRIVRTLGRGGMGVVYEADHQSTARRVALKVMGHSLDDSRARARFLREGRLAASVNHPNSVYVYGSEEIDGRPTISMELVRGGTLQEQVKKSGPLDPTAAVDAILQVIDGLEAAYGVGVLHRDIKPNNCFVDADGQVKVGDFGLSIATSGRGPLSGDVHQQTHTEITQVGTFLGTPAYASPEQLRGEPLDHRSDIYSIGVTLYYLLTGGVPFAADNMVEFLARVLDNAAPSVRTTQRDVAESLDQAIAKCLQKNAGDRFASYPELRKALLPHSSRVPLPATLGSRCFAGVIDYIALLVLLSPVSIAMMIASTHMSSGDPPFGVAWGLWTIPVVLYYGLSEWWYGRTIGKRCLGIRVIQEHSNPRLRWALLRSALYVWLPAIPMFIASWYFGGEAFTQSLDGTKTLALILVGWSKYIVMVAMFATVRSRNGNAAIHDLLTGTRVVQELSLHKVFDQPKVNEAFDAKAGTEMIGPYHILQQLGPTDSGTLLLGYDTSLMRRVWIHRRDAGTPTAPIADRQLSRKTRLRWLGGNATEQETWDCYEAVSGCALIDCRSGDLDWLTAVTALDDLSDELTEAEDDGTLPADLSLKNLWISHAGQLKVLPFTPLPNAPHRNDSVIREDPSHDTPPRCVELLQETAALFSARFAPTEAGNQSLSVTDARHLEQVSAAESVDDAKLAIGMLRNRPPVRVPYRVAGMVAASVALPLMSIATMLLTNLMYDRQEQTMTELRELVEALSVAEQEAEGMNPKKGRRLASVQTYIRANYRELWQDPSRMTSVYAIMQMQRSNRTHRLEAIFAKPPPSEQETIAATKAYRQIRAEHPERIRDIQPPIPQPFQSLNATLLAIIGWIELVWIPSLLTAVLFRGGVLLRLFGLTLVNRHAQRASRSRVFLRMVLTGVLPILTAVLILSYSHWTQGTVKLSNTTQFVVCCLTTLALITMIIRRNQKRLLSDFCAGTYLVAR